MNDFVELLNQFDIQPHDLEVYKRAFTHSSYNVYDKEKQHKDYERIEFMGDAVIEFCVSDILFRLFPDPDAEKDACCQQHDAPDDESGERNWDWRHGFLLFHEALGVSIDLAVTGREDEIDLANFISALHA